MCYSVIAVANYFIGKSLKEGIPVTNFRLQKMSFFAHAAFFHTERKPLVYNIVEAWQHGPVFPDLYEAVKDYGDKEIDSKIAIIRLDKDSKDVTFDYTVPEILSSDTKTIEYLNEVWNICSKMNIHKMRKISHDENGAWYQTLKASGIDDPNDNEKVKTNLQKHLEIPEYLIKDYGI